MKKSLSLALRKRPDQFVLAGITRLIATDRKRKADFLAYLNEVEFRKLHAIAGYSGLCEWLVSVHKMSESSALKRMQVAKLAAKYPFLYESISKGEYSLTVLSRLSSFVKEKNSGILFRAASFKSVRQVEAILADMFPKEEVEEKLQKAISPLGLNRHSVQFTADTEFVNDLARARAHLSHRFPQGRMKDVLGYALKTLLQEIERPRRQRKVKSQATPQPNIPRGIQVPRSRNVPLDVRRYVARRDGYRCQFKRPDGSICGATHFLEADHVQPFALGGGHTPQNLRLLCWTHNALRAELQFGRRERDVRGTRPSSPPSRD